MGFAHEGAQRRPGPSAGEGHLARVEVLDDVGGGGGRAGDGEDAGHRDEAPVERRLAGAEVVLAEPQNEGEGEGEAEEDRAEAAHEAHDVGEEGDQVGDDEGAGDDAG